MFSLIIAGSMNAQTKSTNSKTTQPAMQKTTVASGEIFTLISGNCHEDGCTFTFKNSKGKEVYTSKIPDKVVEFSDTEEGGSEVQMKYLNKKYAVKYKTGKRFHEPSNSYNIEMMITEMKMIK